MSDERVVFPPRKIPTKLKHWILDRYLAAWRAIIVKTLEEPHLLFVDACCGSGLYEPDDNTPGEFEMGSALLGPVALQDAVGHGQTLGRAVTARALLVNENGRQLQTAQASIESAGINVGIAVEYHKARLVDVADLIVERMRDALTFALIDPYGPQATPWSVVSRIVGTPHTDTLINFPFYSFQKWKGFLRRDPSTLAPDESARLDAVDAFFGGTSWRQVVEATQAEGQPLHNALLEHYLTKLRALGVQAFSIPLKFEERDDTVYDLIFTSRNVAGLAAAKKSFVDSQTREIQLRMEADERDLGQASLFAAEEFRPPSINIDKLAERLANRFAGQSPAFKEVILAGLQWSTALESDVRKALTKMKKQRVIKASPERYRDRIAFRKK